nr:hypothetical protein [Streptomyces antibioticus]
MVTFEDGRTAPIEAPGVSSVVPAWEVMLPLTREDFHALGPRRLATRVSWENPLLGGRETYRIGYASHFGWSVLRDWPGWYAAVLTSPHTYEGCAQYITDCIRPGRLWSGSDIQVEEWI